MIRGNTINLEPMNEEDTEAFLTAIKKKKQFFNRKYRNIPDSEVKMRESISRKIELLNCLIAEFGDKKQYNSIKNLGHRAKF
jgi:hypothetical protein